MTIEIFNEEILSMVDVPEVCPNCGKKDYHVDLKHLDWVICNRCNCTFAEWIIKSRKDHLDDWWGENYRDE